MKQLKKSEIHKILVISLSNIGDVILTFPVIDILRRDFPSAKISIVIGPKAETLLKGNPNFEQIYLYDKHQKGWDKFKWILKLRKETFDLAVDLRHSVIPILIGARFSTSMFGHKKIKQHMKFKHLMRLESVYSNKEEAEQKYCLSLTQVDKYKVEQIFSSFPNASFVVIAPGSANHRKQWAVESYAQIADEISMNYHYQIVFIGDHKDQVISELIISKMKSRVVNLCGILNLAQSAEIIRKATLVISNDSAPMHMSSYLDVPTLGLFGPSLAYKYGPWGKQGFSLSAPIVENQLLEEVDINKVTVDEVKGFLRSFFGK